MKLNLDFCFWEEKTARRLIPFLPNSNPGFVYTYFSQTYNCLANEVFILRKNRFPDPPQDELCLPAYQRAVESNNHLKRRPLVYEGKLPDQWLDALNCKDLFLAETSYES